MSPWKPTPRPGAWRRRFVLSGWTVAAAVVCIRAGQIQILEGAQWGALAEAQHTADREVVAARGAVLDRDGAALAVSREVYRVSVAPKEILDRDSVRTLLREVLDLSPARVRALMDRSRRWAVAPGRYPPTVRERLGGVRGVYLEREMERYHPHVDLARGVLGAVMDGKGKGGVEQAFESILRGQPGRAAVPRDNVGRPIPGETYLVTEPRSGGQVVLTLDLDMQEIARQALQEAIESTQARGGDVLVTDPATGEILAMVSIRDGKTAGLGAINTPYEPGSTLKPFTVAGLLSRGLRSLSDLVEVGDGTWTVEGRTLHDSHHPEQRYITISDALRVSSNVGIAKAAQVFTAADQYLNLRDFGFGSPTGIDLPGESAGRLRRPDHWSLQSPASLAIGYEIGVTPLQMAMAYGALANGGLLMEPRLVKEVRDADGRVLERRAPRVVRRVVRPEVARNVGRVLVDVVEDGTGTKARLGTFRVAGKSGTSRAYSPEGGYAGGHNASFVGFFPAEDPQLVIFVRLERPQGADYYGGGVAAPVTRATMEAALAARGTPLNRAQLVKAVQSATTRPAPVPVTFAAQPVDPPPPPVFGDEAGPGAARGDKGDGEPSTTEVGVPVPDVAGLPTRIAVRRLHALGLRVVQDRRGDITGTSPSAGSRVTPGDTVVLVVRRRSDD